MSSSTESTSAIMSIARDWSENASSQTSSSPPDASSSSGPPTTHSSGGPPPPPGPGKRPPLTDEQKAAQRLRRLQMLEKTLSEPVIGVKRLASEAMKGDGSTNGKANVKVGEMDLDVKARPVASGSGTSGPSAATTKSGPAISVTAQISLSPEQQEILKLATSGKNIFFTGSAGTNVFTFNYRHIRHVLISIDFLWLFLRSRYWKVRPAARNHSLLTEEIPKISRCDRNHCFNRDGCLQHRRYHTAFIRRHRAGARDSGGSCEESF
ncbi:hypothetical protein DL93DRAFT_1416230 [Clavulina sp. PMI_390]|nr:hypothetical protein DL93DRAFT_1416230 [Clavulina sp. PMI_390]